MKRGFIVYAFALAVALVLMESCSDAEPSPLLSYKIDSLASPAQDSSSEPFLFTDTSGIVYLSWITRHADQAALQYAVFRDGKWSEPRLIDTGRDWFLNWADYPVIAAINQQQLAAHYLKKSGKGKFAYDINMKFSADGGSKWSSPVKIHDDTTETEHGFVSLIPYGSYFFASWLDGRNTAKPSSHAGHGGHEEHGGEMTLRAGVFSANGRKVEEWELDKRVCDCCQTSATVTENGPVVVYRDRSMDEIRDINIIRFNKGGWSQPVTISNDNWQIKGCPVNGPRIEAIGNSIVVTWYTMQDSVAVVKAVFSEDGGETFSAPILINDAKTIGRLDIALLEKDKAIISWMESGNILARIIHADGKKEKPLVIAGSSEARSSGFPQLTRAGKDIIVAWTDPGSHRVKTAVIRSVSQVD